MPQSAAQEINSLVGSFATRLASLVETATTQRIQLALAAAVGVAPRRGPGRPPSSAKPARVVKRRPKQLCPVPGCKNPAAPVFGMVCGRHRDVPKAKIKKYREQRKAQKTA